jgi:hypothetical protein
LPELNDVVAEWEIREQKRRATGAPARIFTTTLGKPSALLSPIASLVNTDVLQPKQLARVRRALDSAKHELSSVASMPNMFVVMLNEDLKELGQELDLAWRRRFVQTRQGSGPPLNEDIEQEDEE